jgi:3-phenylpropionate/trans-cinnamate dioxygenase ferredoxin reductase component
MAAWRRSEADRFVTDAHADVLLVGGGVAAVRCARELRRGGFDGSIVLIGDEPRLPYNRPPLSKELLRGDLPDDLLLPEPATWYERKGIELRRGVRVEHLDLDARRAGMADGGSIAFDRLLVATGAEERRLGVPGGEGALTLRTVDDARRMRAAALAAGPGAPVVVVGGGFIGLEVASSLAALGLRPTVIELGPMAWAGSLGTELAGWAADRLAGVGVDLRTGVGAARLTNGAVEVAAERLEAAFVVAGIGVTPRTELAAAAGLRVDDGVVVDEGQRTSHAAAWAAGDVARTDGRARIEHWHAAREAGERAARSMMGAPVGPLPVPWLFSDIGGVMVDVIGATDGWDEERWVDPRHSVLAYLREGRVVGIAAIDTAVGAAQARAWVAEGVGIDRIAQEVA